MIVLLTISLLLAVGLLIVAAKVIMDLEYEILTLKISLARLDIKHTCMTVGISLAGTTAVQRYSDNVVPFRKP